MGVSANLDGIAIDANDLKYTYRGSKIGNVFALQRIYHRRKIVACSSFC